MGIELIENEGKRSKYVESLGILSAVIWYLGPWVSGPYVRRLFVLLISFTFGFFTVETGV